MQFSGAEIGTDLLKQEYLVTTQRLFSPSQASSAEHGSSFFSHVSDSYIPALPPSDQPRDILLITLGFNRKLEV